MSPWWNEGELDEEEKQKRRDYADNVYQISNNIKSDHRYSDYESGAPELPYSQLQGLVHFLAKQLTELIYTIELEEERRISDDE